jgi:hypothetical protein
MLVLPHWLPHVCWQDCESICNTHCWHAEVAFEEHPCWHAESFWLHAQKHVKKSLQALVTQLPLQLLSRQLQHPCGTALAEHDGPLNGKLPLALLLLPHAISATSAATAHKIAGRFIGTLL